MKTEAMICDLCQQVQPLPTWASANKQAVVKTTNDLRGPSVIVSLSVKIELDGRTTGLDICERCFDHIVDGDAIRTADFVNPLHKVSP